MTLPMILSHKDGRPIYEQIMVQIPEVVQTGQSAMLTVQHFDDAVLERLKASGATIQQVEHLSEAEEFVAGVESTRKERNHEPPSIVRRRIAKGLQLHRWPMSL